MRPRPNAGFTLIELLIVIAILGVLAAAFLPDLLGAGESAKISATMARMQRLATGCETFARKHGVFPPDDLQPFEAGQKVQFKADNGQNTGIESLVAFLSQSRADGADLSDLGSRYLTNTDGDQHHDSLPLLGRKDRVEVADDWGTPLAYWCKTSTQGGFAKAQTIAVPGDPPELLTASPRKGPEGVVLGFQKFQFLSAGPDGVFGTEDDISYPAR